MPKSAGKARCIQDAKKILLHSSTAPYIASIQRGSAGAQEFIDTLEKVHPSLNSLDAIIDFVLTALPQEPSLVEATEILRGKITKAKREQQQNAGLATHSEKRHLKRVLGFNNIGRTVAEILTTQHREDVGTISNPKIVVRYRMSRDSPGWIERGKVLADTLCRPEFDIICDEAHGFYVVEPDESVIFISYDDQKRITVELAAVRGAAMQLEVTPQLYEWLKRVVITACDERRNTRPTHVGAIVQVGWNAGPRHARAFGLAKSYAENVDSRTQMIHDEDVIAAMTVTWSVCKSLLPRDITAEIENVLEHEKLPRMATRNIDGDTGYKFDIGGKVYSFPNVERSPPEGMFSVDYCHGSHTDPSYARWALLWNVAHRVDAPASTPHKFHHSLPRTRSGGRQQAPPGEDVSRWPAGGGGNFVDLSLRVKVKQAAGTLMAFRPDLPHGTTLLCGAHSMGCTIPFCTRVRDAYQKAQEGISIVAGEGSGF